MNPLVLTDDDGIRPAGDPNKCFYCDRGVGDEHLSTCVVLHKKVKVDYIFTIDIEVPHHWDKESILFHRNEGTWCASNAISELQKIADDNGGCLCFEMQCDVVEMKEAPPYRKNKEGEIVP